AAGAGRRAGRVLLALERPERGHQPGAAVAVVAGAEDLDLEAGRRRRADHDLKRVAGPDRLVRAVAFDPGRAIARLIDAHPGQLPVERARVAILLLDEVRLFAGTQ